MGEGGEQSEFLSEEITFIVTFSPGGGFDTYARGLVDLLPDHLPEDVDFVVENSTPNFTGLMDIWRADPDGHTIGTTAALGMVARQIVEDVPYDMREFTWLARMALTEYMIAAGADTGYESVDDLREADEVDWATPGAGTTAWLASIISASDLEINFNVVNFEGTQEAAAAVLRGDADVMLGPTTTPSLTEPLNAGDMTPIVSFTDEQPETVPETDTATDIGQEGLMNLNLNRPVFGPPDIPDDRANTLSESIVETLESDEMQPWAEENERPINATGRDEMSDTISGAFDTLSEYEDLLNDHLDQ
ncbi:Bug family tripartite tricarboxylate transporter substrate binding protein [Natrinema soli]|uniref:Bug family tripartite tricarboxylate transporter substrate binding protein n=1 Tax=Natrinema soli TaxID=1930624 RepID=A0ABD5SNL8_9EURY|nr:tripartite tricarboxylate transporter substrate-binding protein [Natrinema soli]